MSPEKEAISFIDWSFSQGRPNFADDWGKEDHTRFCIEFLKNQLSGNGGITGPVAVFSHHLDQISKNASRNIDFLMAYYIYMNTYNDCCGRQNDISYKEIEIDVEKIRKVMVLA